MSDDTHSPNPSAPVPARYPHIGGVLGGEAARSAVAPPLVAMQPDQVRWMAHRMMAHSDLEACVEMERQERGSVTEWLDRVEAWKADPGFVMGYTYCLGDPKEGTKWLATALLPAIIPALMDTINTPRTRSKGIELLLKMHGMFVDKVEVATQEDIRVLVADLRRPTVLPPAPKLVNGRAHVVKDDEDGDL